MGSGKTTISRHLVDRHGFLPLSFAGPLKAMCFSLLTSSGMSEGQAHSILSDRELKEAPLKVLNGRSPRFAMQMLGTEWGRGLFGEDLWVNIGITKAKSLMERGHSVVFDDLRFPNEAEAIEAAGGVVLRVTREDCEIVGEKHASEGSLDAHPVWATVYNTGTVWSLLDNIDYLMPLISRK